MNYKLILDEEKLDKFIEWLPDLRKDDNDNEVFYMCLFARKKYFKDLISSSNDKTQLRRELVTKKNIKRELRKWQCELGSYKLKNDIVPQESLAVYINPNPRSMKKGMFNHLKELADFASKNNIPHNLHQNAISCVQRSKSYNYVVDFDIDDKTIDLELIEDILSPGTYDILETRGGYHILVYPKYATNKLKELVGNNPSMQDRGLTNWYQNLTKIYNIDQSGDNMIPVPGCCQGGFCPKFIN